MPDVPYLRAQFRNSSPLIQRLLIRVNLNVARRAIA